MAEEKVRLVCCAECRTVKAVYANSIGEYIHCEPCGYSRKYHDLLGIFNQPVEYVIKNED